MESYEDRTYLWGATVRLRRPVPGLAQGYVGVVSWEQLDERVEGEIFARFWTWLEEVRERCQSDGASFRAYCFWAQAEDGAMNRALQFLADPALRARVEQFRRRESGEWIDLHDVVTHQIQTDGPTGLKKLARAAGFEWRDESPSGEASLHWYRQAVAQGPDSATWRERLLQYNEDDCVATAALRDWLNGPAKALVHRDDWPPRDGTS
jgi:predicted RecB family nuclease